VLHEFETEEEVIRRANDTECKYPFPPRKAPWKIGLEEC
jgi:hypothetical protein